MKALRAVNNFLASASLTLAMLIIFIMVAALFLSATTRFVTGTGFAWFIELPPVLVSWLVFPLLGPLLKKGQHIKVDFSLLKKCCSIFDVFKKFFSYFISNKWNSKISLI